MNKPSILIVCSDPIVIAQHLHEIIREFSLYSNVSISTNLDTLDNYSRAFDLIPIVNYIHVPISRFPAPFTDFICVFKLLSILLSNRYQLVLSFTPKGGLICSLSVWLFRLFSSRHLSYIHYFTGLLWQHLKSSTIRSLVFSFVDYLIISAASKIFCDSRSQLQFLSHHFPQYSYKFNVIHSGSLKGVDTEYFYPLNPSLKLSLRTNYSIPEDSFVLLFIGRVTYDKGIDLLLSSFETISNLLPSCVLLVVGPIEHPDFKFLASDPNPNLIYVPFTSEPWIFYNISDALVLPSIREGFGSVVIEAAACSIPTIGSSIPGLVDSIVHLKTGLLFSQGNLDQLISSIQFFYNQKTICHEFGQAARLRAVADFSQSLIVKDLVSTLLRSI